MHVYLKHGFMLFPAEQMKLTRLSSEGVYLYSGCILSCLFGNARGRSWVVFSRNRVRLHGVTPFNSGSMDYCFSKREIRSIYTNDSPSVPFLRTGYGLDSRPPFLTRMYYFYTAPALRYRWPMRYRFLIVEMTSFYILMFVESEREVRLYQEQLKKR